jgi:hypothetical protein
VGFVPSTAGPYSDQIVFFTNAGTQTVQLIGRGVASTLPFKAIPSSLDFGFVTTGTSKYLDLTIRNVGASPLTLQNWTVSGPGFSVLSQQVPPLTLVTGQSLTMEVLFSPTADGAANGAVNFTTSAGPKVVPLTGKGWTPPFVDFTPIPGPAVGGDP